MNSSEIVLFCKSFAGDRERLCKLLRSIDQYNKEQLPVYISVPVREIELFEPLVSKRTYAKLLTDEDLLARSDALGSRFQKDFSGGLMQQIVKIAFGMTGEFSRYVVIDSDSFFIRSFGKKDFLSADGSPFTIMHDCKDLLDFAERKGMHFVKNNYEKERIQFQNLFDRKGHLYDFGPTPVIWGSEVWQKLAKDYLLPNSISLSELISRYPSELLVYGEALLKYQPFTIHPRGPLFKVYHYAEQFEDTDREEKTEEKLSQKYLGIVMQSNWHENTKRLKPSKRFNKFLRKLLGQE